MTGAPASFDVFAVSPEGLEVHFQLSGEKVYAESRKLLAQLVADGFTPRTQRAGRGSQAPQGPLCEQHGVNFRQYAKDGKTWFAHKQGDGWCNQPTKKEQAG